MTNALSKDFIDYLGKNVETDITALHGKLSPGQAPVHAYDLQRAEQAVFDDAHSRSRHAGQPFSAETLTQMAQHNLAHMDSAAWLQIAQLEKQYQDKVHNTVIPSEITAQLIGEHIANYKWFATGQAVMTADQAEYAKSAWHECFDIVVRSVNIKTSRREVAFFELIPGGIETLEQKVAAMSDAGQQAQWQQLVEEVKAIAACVTYGDVEREPAVNTDELSFLYSLSEQTGVKIPPDATAAECAAHAVVLHVKNLERLAHRVRVLVKYAAH